MSMFIFGAVCGGIVTWLVTHLYHNANFQRAIQEERSKLYASVDKARQDLKDRL